MLNENSKPTIYEQFEEVYSKLPTQLRQELIREKIFLMEEFTKDSIIVADLEGNRYRLERLKEKVESCQQKEK
jgi:hypothetical protein